MGYIDDKIQNALTDRTGDSPTGDYLETFDEWGMGNGGSWTVPAGGFSWNESGWAFGLDFSGVGSFFGASSKWYSCALLSPRHVLISDHTKPAGSGYSIFFINGSGEVHEAIMDSEELVISDLRLIYLTADVPASYTRYPTLPATYDTQLTYNASDLQDMIDASVPILSPDGLYGKPIVFVDQERKAMIGRVYRIGEGAPNVQNIKVAQHSPTRPERLAYYPDDETLITGDSGGPNWLLVDGELVLLAIAFAAGSIGTWEDHQATSFLTADIRDLVNASMASLHGSTEHQIITFDLAAASVDPNAPLRKRRFHIPQPENEDDVDAVGVAVAGGFRL